MLVNTYQILSTYSTSPWQQSIGCTYNVRTLTTYRHERAPNLMNIHDWPPPTKSPTTLSAFKQILRPRNCITKCQNDFSETYHRLHATHNCQQQTVTTTQPELLTPVCMYLQRHEKAEQSATAQKSVMALGYY